MVSHKTSIISSIKKELIKGQYMECQWSFHSDITLGIIYPAFNGAFNGILYEVFLCV
jgi:hypothetical protein